MIDPWFVETVCIDKVNASEMLLADVKRRFPYNQNVLVGDLEKLVSKMDDGDIIQFYRSSDSTWQQLAGRAGYELMRGDKTIVNVLIAMN